MERPKFSSAVVGRSLSRRDRATDRPKKKTGKEISWSCGMSRKLANLRPAGDSPATRPRRNLAGAYRELFLSFNGPRAGIGCRRAFRPPRCIPASCERSRQSDQRVRRLRALRFPRRSASITRDDIALPKPFERDYPRSEQICRPCKTRLANEPRKRIPRSDSRPRQFS